MARIEDSVNGPSTVTVDRPMHRRGAGRYCAARHPLDGSRCDGDPNAVRVLVGQEEVLACVKHAARLYASVSGAEVQAVGGPNGPNADAPAEVVRRAVGIKPFFWMHEPVPPDVGAARVRRAHFTTSPIRSWLHDRSPWRP